MKTSFPTIFFLVSSLTPLIWSQESSDGLAPEITDLNTEDVSFASEQDLPYLKSPYLAATPTDLGDGISVGELGKNGGKKARVLAFANRLAKPSENSKTGKTDSLLVSYRGKLIFEAYYRRGRINYPHYQMSITKSYTAMAIGRAIQLGHLSMADLHQPVISFLNDLDRKSLAPGAEKITLHEAMHMCSGIRLPKEKITELRSQSDRLLGQGQIQAYLQHSAPIPAAPREFKYQASDTALAMQVLEAVVPGSAKDFLRDELWGPLGVADYQWQPDTSGLPKAAAGSSFRSRDMLKMGQLILNQGKWQGKQHIPAEFIAAAVRPNLDPKGNQSYGYFWWSSEYEVAGKTYPSIQGRGAGGQFLFIFPDIDLIAVVTAHNKGMGKMLNELPKQLIPAFAPAGITGR